ncbi:MAG TPA: hypothetical protein VG271_03705 [Beijerinckiaceae bacterium]|nr:hypothetical protein [Beijerinckiaceae bacterium]
MKNLAIVFLAFGIFAAPASLAYAQAYTSSGWSDPAPDSATSPLHGTHDKGAIVRVLNNNGIYGRMNEGRSVYEGTDQLAPRS